MNKRILILSKEQPPVVGGAGIVAMQLLENLNIRAWEVTLNIPPVKFFKSKKLNNYSNLIIAFYYCLKGFFFNSVIINDLFYKKLFCIFFHVFRINNTLVYLHGSEPEFLLSSPFFRERFIFVLLRSKAIIAVSNYMKEKFISSLEGHEKYDEIKNKIVVIKNGVDSSVFYCSKPIRSSSLINISTCCRLEWGKGFKDMSTLMIELLDADVNFHWFIAGNGSDAADIKAYIAEQGLSNYVTFLGVLSRDEVAKLFNESQFMLLLSDFKESLGLVYMEASCCGCYSIGRNNYGVKESIVSGETGALVGSIHEAFNVLVTQKINSENISNIALERYSSDLMYKQIELLFK